MHNSDELLNLRQAADLLGMSVRAVHRLVASGSLPSVKLPGRTGAYVVTRGAVDNVLATRVAS